MSVKFLEMKFDGREYKDKNGFVWKLDSTKNNFYSHMAEIGVSVLTLYYTHKQLVDMEFEEVIDWSKVPIDTKILVWDRINKQKHRRHFAGIDDVTKQVKAWNDGQTSFTTTRWNTWENVELYEEEDK